MNCNRAITLMMNHGYQVMGSNVPCLVLMFQRDDESGRMNIVGLIDNVGKAELSPEQLDNISFQIERKFLIGQYAREVNIIYLVFSDNFERDKQYSRGASKFWLMDVTNKRIVVFEEQPDDFYNLKGVLRNFFDDDYDNDAGRVDSRSNSRTEGTRKKRFPIMTLLLIAINVLVFIWLEMHGDTENPGYMLKKGAAYGKYIFDKHEYYRLFTSMFMHFGAAHLINNMLALWIMGSKLEVIIGNVRFIILYIISGLTGSIVSSVYYYNSRQPTVAAGASGAIYGVLGAILVVAIMQWRRNDKSIFVRMGLVFLMMFYGSGAQGVDNLAHMGGLVGGIILMVLLKIFSDKHILGKLKKQL